MTTSRASSASEGEIFDIQHKANKVDQKSESSINGSNRGFGLDGTSGSYDNKYRALSRSPSPYRRKRTRSPSPYRNRRVIDRSPSPYRHRPRADRAHENSEARSYQKRRTSPPRANRPEKRPHTDNNRHDHRQRLSDDDSRAPSALVDRPSNKRISYAELDNANAVPDFRDNLSINGQASKPTGNQASRDVDSHGFSKDQEYTRTDLNKHIEQHRDGDDTKMTNTADEPEYEPVVNEEQVPSQESREEKRRRWAAKRAAAEQRVKESLLHKAVLTNASEVTTPNVASPALIDSPTSPFGSPQLGDLDSVPASPDVMIVDKHGGLSEGNSSAAASPSAADYDPMQDMLDDRDRAAKKSSAKEVSSNAYNETDPQALSTLPAEKVAPVKRQKELDMFASDDEDEDEDASAVQEQQAETKGTVLDEKLLDNWDDPEGYYKLISNELVNNGRYRVVRSLGRGVFANVAQAVDVHSSMNDRHQIVAIKMIRRNELMRKASQKEMDFLRKVNEADPQDKRHVIRLLGSFDHKGHLCIVFEHMSKNLRDLLKEETNGHGLTLPAVRIYAKQMFLGLQHLQQCQVIHLDLKPDNVLVSADKKMIKLADFGTAVDKRDIIERTEYLVSRFYRAPEIILGMEISYPVDMWAVGCTVYELWTGKILFTGRSNNQMVKAFMDCLGWPSEKLLRKGLANNILEHFEFGSSLKFVSREVDQQNKLSVRKIEQQKKINRDLKTRVHDAARSIAAGGPNVHELNDLADLLNACLHMNVEKRATPKEALTHKFFGSRIVPSKSTVVKPPVMKRGMPGVRR